MAVPARLSVLIPDIFQSIYLLLFPAVSANYRRALFPGRPRPGVIPSGNGLRPRLSLERATGAYKQSSIFVDILLNVCINRNVSHTLLAGFQLIPPIMNVLLVNELESGFFYCLFR